MAFSALVKSLGSQVPPRPPVADKAICTSPLFTGSTMSKRPADASPEMRVPPKRSAGFSGPIQTDQNNNVAEDCDDYVLVDKRRRQRRKPQPQMPINGDHASRALRPRPPHRQVHHRPNAIIIKADDPSTYANILKKLKGDPALQQTVGSSVNNIRRSAADALVLQLKKGVDNASDLGEELGKVLGTTATASALQHTSMIEIKDLDESVTKGEITIALDALLGVPVSRRDPVKSLRKAYAGTQVAVVALPDDLAATALKLGHVRIGWVNCRIRAREEAARCYRCWSPGHVAARCKGPDRTELCYRCGQKGHQAKDCKGQPSQGSSIVDLTFVCETLAPHVKSWTVSGRYTHSNHQAIFFEIEDTGTSTRPSMRQSRKWNARTLDAGRFSSTMSSALVAPGTLEDMASSLMSVVITGACDASMSKANPRRRREPVYWWTPEITDLRRSCLRARRLFQRSRGRHDEENPQRELRLSKASSARGDQDQQTSVLEALRRGQQRRLGQTIQDCHVTPRMPAGQVTQLPSPGARRGGGSVSAGAERARPATAASSGGAHTGRHLGGTQRSSVEDKGALGAQPGWRAQHGAQARCCHAS
ncbi:unnamed protein product [Trichogramma brassicae]|uniref:CCHC-type domain-containing protein n=1 Tax=Trichogramma brassicae TaxID=86971 RepID=A0A6H5J9K8_9HYME|nr:unnamed protein product [Trichogramma brassicae]